MLCALQAHAAACEPAAPGGPPPTPSLLPLIDVIRRIAAGLIPGRQARAAAPGDTEWRAQFCVLRTTSRVPSADAPHPPAHL